MSFTTAADTFARLETTSGDVLTVSNVSLHALQDMDREREARGRKVRFFYFAEQKYLIITIPTRSHEALHNQLEGLYLVQVARMGLFASWERTSAGRFPNHPPAGSNGEGDAGGQPLPARGRKDAWPTLVIESGYSQTLPSLRMKMRLWFTMSGHEVKIVVLVKAFPGSREKRILFEHLQERPAPPRPGATTTRSQSSNGTSAECIQTINVVWALETPYEEASEEQKISPASFNVTRGPLVLDFARCFLREPIGPQEHDFVFPDWELQTCAARVWELE